MRLGTKSKKIFFATFVAAILLMALFLSQVFSGRLILPQSFNIGPLIIRYYGITMALAVLAGYLLAKKRAGEYGINSKDADDLMFWTAIGGFLGARLYHIASSAGFYSQHPLDALKVWNGGLSIYGAVFGGVITLWLYQKTLNHKSKILNLLDWLAPSVVLGQIIGRFGNLFNYEAFGYPTDLPWKMFVPAEFRPAVLSDFQYFHPLFIYEAIGNAIILFLLLKFLKRSHPGALFFSYLLLYNVLRFFIEFLRTDSTFIYGFRLNVLTSFLLATIAFIALLFILWKAKMETKPKPET